MLENVSVKEREWRAGRIVIGQAKDKARRWRCAGGAVNFLKTGLIGLLLRGSGSSCEINGAKQS
jgi:hypothetical protein